MIDYRASPRPSGSWQIIDPEGRNPLGNVLFLDKRAAIEAILALLWQLSEEAAA